MCVCMHTRRPEDKLVSVSSRIPPCGFWDWTPVLRLGGKCFYLLSYLAGLLLVLDDERIFNRISFSIQIPVLIMYVFGNATARVSEVRGHFSGIGSLLPR